MKINIESENQKSKKGNIRNLVDTSVLRITFLEGCSENEVSATILPKFRIRIQRDTLEQS